jgi:hypothetical protein
VAALGELLGGRDQGLAAAARRHLEQVAAGDDSRRVSAAASAALAASPPAPRRPPPDVAAKPPRAASPPPEAAAPPHETTATPPRAASPPPEAAAPPAEPAATSATAPPTADPSPDARPRRRPRLRRPSSPAEAAAAAPEVVSAPPRADPAPTSPPGAGSSNLAVRVWRRLDVHSRWLIAAAVLLVVSLRLDWDYGNDALDLLDTESYGPVGVGVLLVLVTVVAAVVRRRRVIAYPLFVLTAATLGLVLAMLRIQGGEGASYGLWIGSAGVIVALVTAVLIVLGAPTRRRPRLLPAEVVGALAGLIAAYQGRSYYDPNAAELVASVVAALAAPALALPRPARLRPLLIVGFGAFVVGFLALADLGDAAARAFVAGLVMIVAGGVALYQRTAQP